MDDDTLRALIRGIVAEEQERSIPAIAERVRDLIVGRRGRLSPAEMEQRRAAASASLDSRRKKSAALQKRRATLAAKAERPVNAEEASESDTYERPVQRGGNGEHPPAGMEPSTAVWLRYSTAFKLRYGAFPPRNARANSLVLTLLKLIPAPEAPDVAEFYIRCEDPFYVKANHPLQLLVRDAEKLAVMAATGRTKAETAAPRPWWESWPGIQEQGRQLGIDESRYDNPTLFRRDVLQAAAAWGSLPAEAAAELGMRPREG